MKYTVGTKIKIDDEFGDSYLGEVIDPKDSRVDKLVLPGDVCVYWTTCSFMSTYDPEFLDERAEIINPKLTDTVKE